ncbi:hypothetical protein KEM54_004091, partial [Ascosphaera aggregata]
MSTTILRPIASPRLRNLHFFSTPTVQSWSLAAAAAAAAAAGGAAGFTVHFLGTGASQRTASRSSSTKSSNSASTGTARFDWEDPLNTANLLTDEELSVQHTARRYCQERLQPRVL